MRLPAVRGAISISPCGAAEVQRLQDFIDSRWRRGHVLARDRELLLWQYDSRRMDRQSWPGAAVLLARRGDDIVGMQCLIPATFNVLGRRVAGVWLSNLLAVPEVRGQGVGLQLLQAVNQQGFDVVFDLGVGPQVTPLFLAMGYEIIEDVPRWVALLNRTQTEALLAACAEDVSAAAPDSPRGLSGILDELPAVRPSPGTADVRVFNHAGAIGPWWDELWCRELAPRHIGTARDAAYLNWRYVGHPRFAYDVLVARGSGSGRILGLAVSRMEAVRGRGEKVCRIVDLLAPHPPVAAVLAGAVLLRARARGAAFADFYCSSGSMAGPLGEVGFARADLRSPLAGLPARFCPLEPGPFRMTAALRIGPGLRQELGRLVQREELYITKSDGDMDRPNICP